MAKPFSQEYWHMGDTAMRFANRTSRIFNSSKRPFGGVDWCIYSVPSDGFRVVAILSGYRLNQKQERVSCCGRERPADLGRFIDSRYGLSRGAFARLAQCLLPRQQTTGRALGRSFCPRHLRVDIGRRGPFQRLNSPSQLPTTVAEMRRSDCGAGHVHRDTAAPA